MREILFRGKTIANKSEWVEGFYNHIPHGRFLCDEHCIQTIAEDGRIRQLYDVYESTVGQFTGLTDRNGNKLFEGDIVKFTDSPFGYAHTGTVVFHEGAFRIKYERWNRTSFHRIDEKDVWRDMGASGEVTYTYEKLGNIHDNPEMLEVKDGN